MRRSRLVLLFVVMPFLCPCSHAQAWSGIISPSRAIDWSAAGVTGGIPNNRTTVCASLVTTATAAQIQSALNACPSGQVVSLAAGAYTLTSGITIPSNVTLRGAGANLTTLTFTGSSNYYWGSYVIGFIGNYTGGFEGSAPGMSGSMNCKGTAGPPPTYSGCTQLVQWLGTNGVTGTYTRGATVLNLASVPSSLVVGETLQLTQADDQAVVSVGPLVCQQTAGSNGCSREGQGLTYSNTAMRQNVKVTAINGTAVTVTPGIYADFWTSAKNPVAFWWSNDTRMAGLENLAVIETPAVWAAIVAFEASDCWVKGISLHVASGAVGSGAGTRNGFLVHSSRNITIQDNFLDQMFGGGFSSTTSYGMTNIQSSATLWQNNILYNVESPIISTGGVSGDVYAYNYDPGVCTPSTGCTGIFLGHDEGGMYYLLEGNVGPLFRKDTFHGNETFLTFFRNRFTGTEVNSGANNAEPAFDVYALSRYYNVIGNVLGTTGVSSIYECSNSAASGCNRYGPSIFRLGYPGESATTGAECEGSNCLNPDSQVKATMMRWGNYDTVNAAVRFVSSEVPSGIPDHANPVPSSQSLPPSFYLSTKPSWFASTEVWPPIGPDVTGGTVAGVGGHAYNIPAQDCYTSINAVKASFNAATCYATGSVSGPAPPTGLTAVVQ